MTARRSEARQQPGRVSSSPRRRALLVGGAALLVACNAILGIEEAELIEGEGGHGGTGTGVGVPCQQASQCNDQNPCTTDDCDLTVGRCTNEPLPDGPAPAEAQTDGDCHEIRCQQGDAQNSIDDNDLPVDDLQCTEDRCSSGTSSNPAAPDGTECDQSGGKVCYLGDCVDCYDNSHCTPPDTCGGGLTPLECGCTPTACVGVTCNLRQDLVCHDPDPPFYINCNNGQQDGTETDVDCGGLTAPSPTCDVTCEDGKYCQVVQDCTSGICNCGVCGHTGGCGGGGGAGGS